MSAWYVKNLGDAMLASEQLEHIQALFQSEFEKTKPSREIAIFLRHESEGRLHCEVVVYFSPASRTIAAAVGAVSCKKPSCEGLGLLAGSEDSWPILFPEKHTI